MATVRDTKLTAWFKLNQTDPDARAHLYIDIPTFYTWHAQRKVSSAIARCPLHLLPLPSASNKQQQVLL